MTEGSDGRYTATALHLVARTQNELYGSVTFRGKKPFLRVDREVSNTDWPLKDVPKPLMKEGLRLVGRLEGDRVVPVRAVQESDSSLERVRVRYGIRTTFPNVATLPEVDGASRRDLRELVTITIDAPTSMDLDDALSVLPAAEDGGLRVMVSIADVDALVPEGSLLDVEARIRGTSVYLAGGVTPMLPHTLSEDQLSLLPEQDRPALTAELRIDPDGEITAVDLFESTIRSNTRLSYIDTTAFLDRGENTVPNEVKEILRWLRAASARIATVRRAEVGFGWPAKKCISPWTRTPGSPPA